MPEVFNCTECHLAFTVGWFHYHCSNDEYWSRTLLVCKSCGTGYATEHSLCKTFNRLFAQSEPIRCNLSREKEPLFVPYSEWTIAKTSISFPTDLEGLECSYCHAIGTLVSNWSTKENCPACGEQAIDCVGDWVT